MRRSECEKIIKKITRRATHIQKHRLNKRRFEKCRYFPVTLREIYLFGSYLKGKERPNDVDLIITYKSLFASGYDPYERRYYWRSDMRGHDSINTAHKKITRGIDGDKIDVMMKAHTEDVFEISPEGKIIEVDKVQKIWDANAPIVFHGLSTTARERDG